MLRYAVSISFLFLNRQRYNNNIRLFQFLFKTLSTEQRPTIQGRTPLTANRWWRELEQLVLGRIHALFPLSSRDSYARAYHSNSSPSFFYPYYVSHSLILGGEADRNSKVFFPNIKLFTQRRNKVKICFCQVENIKLICSPFSSPLKVLSSKSNVCPSGDVMRSLLLAALFALLDMMWETKIGVRCIKCKQIRRLSSKVYLRCHQNLRMPIVIMRLREFAHIWTQHPIALMPKRLFRFWCLEGLF